MIFLRFEGGPEPTPSLVLGPSSCFHFISRFLRQGPEGMIVGAVRDHIWEIEGKRYPRYFCTEPHIIRFNGSKNGGEAIRLGPLSRTWGEDGLLHPDFQMRAKSDDTSLLWHEFKTDTFWPEMIIEAVESGP